ncbi:MAG TPA: sigma-54-dependent Fis family transcriptional regulator [Firmicutes bacterium]|nr:sigma-54-dependent Fis family transcriptional regulator [Bacillota bacterium]
MNEILVVEDNEELRNIVMDALSGPENSLDGAESAEKAYELLEEKDYDMIISDLKLPEDDGIAVLEKAKTLNPLCEVIIVTAFGTVDKAVVAMKKGAADFITKPFSIEHIRMKIAGILETKKIKDENRYMKSVMHREIVGKSAAFKSVQELSDKIAGKDATVLITGGSGTGKELIAERIHMKSLRAGHSLVKVNCAALAPGVLESELFGHEKGAFTDAHFMKKGRFELAEKGTIFLDEIGDMPPPLQIKLLRVIQEREFERVGGEKTIKADVRIIAATNMDLKKAVENGLFRKELYYRLNVVEIKMPLLKERKEDIPLLADYFIKKYAEYGDYRVKGISKDAVDMLMSYEFPGNIRELENLVQRIMVVSKDSIIKLEDIPEEVKSTVKDSGEDFAGKIENVEKKLIIEALGKTGGNRVKAAAFLKMNRPTMVAKMKKYGIS